MPTVVPYRLFFRFYSHQLPFSFSSSQVTDTVDVDVDAESRIESSLSHHGSLLFSFQLICIPYGHSSFHSFSFPIRQIENLDIFHAIKDKKTTFLRIGLDFYAV